MPKDVITKSETIRLRVSADEVKAWRAAAKRERVYLSEWIRRRCNAAAGGK
jgi:hypothetical protein